MDEMIRSKENQAFLEQLRRDMQKEEAEIERLAKEIAGMEPSNTLYAVYESLIRDAKDRVVGYQGLISEMESAEAPQKIDVSDMQTYFEQTDEEHWTQLMEQAREAGEVETAEFAEDVLALQDSVADPVRFAEKADAELAEVEDLARNAIEQMESLLTKTGEDIFNDVVQTAKDSGIEMSEEQMSKLRMEMMAKHPVAFLGAEIKDNIENMRRTLSEIKDARLAYKQEYGGWKTALKKTGDAFAIKMNQTLLPIKSTVLETGRNALQMTAGALGTTAMAFVSFAEKAKETLLNSVRALSKFADKTIDAVTLGMHAKISEKMDSKFASIVEKYEAEHPEVKSRTFAQKMRDEFSLNLEYQKYSMAKCHTKRTEMVRGTDSASYWKDVTDNAFMWGVLRDSDGKENGYLRSPAQAVQDGVLSAKDYVVDKSKEAAAFVKETVQNTKNSVEGHVLEFKADMYERTAAMYEKKERRIGAKVELLEKTDKELFEVNVQLKQALHKLTEITKFERLQYIPDPQITASLNALKSISTPDAKIAFMVSTLEKDLAKTEKKFNKEADKAEAKHNKETFVDKLSKSVLEGQIDSNENKYAKNIEKLECARGKLAGIQAKAAPMHEKAASISKQAVQKLAQVQKQVADEYER